MHGPWIAASHYDDPRSADAFYDGWFRTGDVVNLDPDGFMQITDRAKDVIKSGGERISSVELETRSWATRRARGGRRRSAARDIQPAADAVTSSTNGGLQRIRNGQPEDHRSP